MNNQIKSNKTFAMAESRLQLAMPRSKTAMTSRAETRHDFHSTSLSPVKATVRAVTAGVPNKPVPHAHSQKTKTVSRALTAAPVSSNFSSEVGPSGRRSMIHGRISSRNEPSTIALTFNAAGTSAAQRATTPFSTAYQRGFIPCRLAHGSVRHRLQWNEGVPLHEPVYLDDLLWLFVSGLRETQHPYVFLVTQGLKEICAALPDLNSRLRDASNTFTRLALALRDALLDPASFDRALLVCGPLVASSGPLGASRIVPYIVAPLARVLTQQSHHGAAILTCLQTCEQAGGAATGQLIKSKIPIYTRVLSDHIPSKK